MKRLVLVRHGETDFNKAHRLQGQTDTPLNAAGIQQAKQVALALRSERFNAIWSSPLERAFKTAEKINEFHQLPIERHSHLKERSFGQLEGCSLKTSQEAKLNFTGHDLDFKPSGGESFRELKTRADILSKALIKSKHDHLLIVAHAGIFRALIGELLQLEFKQWQHLAQHNTCINTFIYNENSEIVAHSLNDHEHCL